MAQKFTSHHQEIEVLILRPAIVLGAHTQNIITKMTEWPSPGFPWIVQVRGADPPVQFLAEVDTTEILYRAVKSSIQGIFNCAGDSVMPFSDFIRQAGKKRLVLPAFIAYPIASLLWSPRLAPLFLGLPDMFRYPWVADNARLKKLFGYKPRHTSQQPLDSFLEARKPDLKTN